MKTPVEDFRTMMQLTVTGDFTDDKGETHSANI